MHRISVRIVCLGLDERDIVVVRSLLRLIDGRRNISWGFHDGMEEAPEAVTVMIAHVSVADACRRAGGFAKVICAFPDGEPVPADADLLLHHPLRAAELLTLLNRLEETFSFGTAAFLARFPAEAVKVSAGGMAEEDVRISSFPSQTVQKRTVPESLRQAGAPDRAMTYLNPPHASHPADLPPMGGRLPTVGALVAFLQDGGQGQDADLFDSRGWIARLRGKQTKAWVSSCFMLESGASPRAEIFRWKPAPDGGPLLEPGDRLVEIETDLFAWRFAGFFCRDLATLAIPEQSELHLKRWPDFGVLPQFSSRPGVLLATALLTQQPRSLPDLCRESKASEADLSYLLGACWLCGWLHCRQPSGEMQMQPSITAAEAENNQAGKKGFSAVVRSLRKVLGF